MKEYCFSLFFFLLFPGRIFRIFSSKFPYFLVNIHGNGTFFLIAYRASKKPVFTGFFDIYPNGHCLLVYPGGFEPLASGVGVLRSIQLSYEYLFLYCLLIIHCYLHKIKKGYLLSLKKDDEVAKLGYSI